MQALRAGGTTPSIQEFEDMVKRFGSEPTLEQFLEALQVQKDRRLTVDQLMEQFKTITSPDGTMDVEVLRYIVTNLGEKLGEKEADELVNMANKDQNGKFRVAQLANSLLGTTK